MTPAKASKPFMKLRGPEARPPPDRIASSSRNDDKLEPVPEPHLNSMPSVLARSRMDSRESFTETMKPADPCGRVCPASSFVMASVLSSQTQPYPRPSFTPTLNQTG